MNHHESVIPKPPDTKQILNLIKAKQLWRWGPFDWASLKKSQKAQAKYHAKLMAWTQRVAMNFPSSPIYVPSVNFQSSIWTGSLNVRPVAFSNSRQRVDNIMMKYDIDWLVTTKYIQQTYIIYSVYHTVYIQPYVHIIYADVCWITDILAWLEETTIVMLAASSLVGCFENPPRASWKLRISTVRLQLTEDNPINTMNPKQQTKQVVLSIAFFTTN